MDELAFSTHSFTDAKSHLSDLMSGVVRDHQPAVVERFRGKEAMALMALDDLRRILDCYEFHTTAFISEGEFVLNQQDLGLIAGGETFEEALSELKGLALSYARQFFDRSAFYLETDRTRHYPYLLKIAATPPGELDAVLVPGPDRASP